MRKEQATALQRVGLKLESLIAQLHQIESTTRDPAEHRKVRTEAEKYYWYMMIQREAIGLRNHDDLKRFYPIPPPLAAER